jgi:mannose-1-phosphate guanylyltransferase
MKGLVLAAGKGERLKPLTDRIPKVLLEVGGRPLIHYALMMLKRAGVTKVAVNVHHLASEIERSLGSGRALGVDITYCPEPRLFGTGGPLLALRGYFGDEPFIVVNSDTTLGLDLPRMIEFHRSRGALATLALHRPANIERYSRLEIDRDAVIRRIRLRTADGFNDHPTDLPADIALALESYMYCGLTICDPAVYAHMPSAPPFSLVGDIIIPMVEKRMPVLGYVHQGFFRTVDDLASYEKLKAEFAEKPPALDYME